MPSWAVSSEIALSCDFDDAAKQVQAHVPMTYIGTRTRTKFVASRIGTQEPGFALLVSGYVAPIEDAPNLANLLGAAGGWVDEKGTVHGANDAWKGNLADTRIASQAPGTLVSLVMMGPPHQGQACFGGTDGKVGVGENGQLLVCPNVVRWHRSEGSAIRSPS